MGWNKAKDSCANGCVEVNVKIDTDEIFVRDSKEQGWGPVLLFTKAEWRAFISGAKNGEFDV